MPTFNLVTRKLVSQKTAAGDQVYWGGELFEIHGQGQGQGQAGQGHGRLVGTFGAVMETINGVTDVMGMDTSLLTLQLFIPSAQHGQHGGQGGTSPQPPLHGRGQAPETIVLQGATEFDGQPSQAQPRQVDRAKGSVSATSQQFAQLKDHQFILENNRLVIS